MWYKSLPCSSGIRDAKVGKIIYKCGVKEPLIWTQSIEYIINHVIFGGFGMPGSVG